MWFLWSLFGLWCVYFVIFCMEILWKLLCVVCGFLRRTVVRLIEHLF